MTELLTNQSIKPCQLTVSSPKIHLVENSCTSISYTIAFPYADTQKMCSLYIKTKTSKANEAILP